MLHTDLLIGAAGWENEKWVGGFYPADLPEDWRFGYYTNRLRSVLVPAGTWTAADTEPLIATMLDDLYPEFRMVMQWDLPAGDDATVRAEEFLDKTRPLDTNVDAYLVSVSGPASSVRLKAIEQLQQRHPVCLMGSDAPVGKEFSAMDGVSLCWLTDVQPKPMAQGQFLVALSSTTEPRGIREIIEKIDAWPESLPAARGAALFFINEKAADTAFQARTIAELMGI